MVGGDTAAGRAVDLSPRIPSPEDDASLYDEFD
jgi:hypothetical protein